ncbi:hypothetical protein EVAR_2507_1 [Eumeta japonica]|uniref:Uncharacterized protein n=1 Tax=Eumeta variegata TaxID=151549 RepID=A0A4C1SRE3_EUMVA|nr:hypothetical protein EVAR_2507_1 [Eumeta japonica]
MADPSRQQCVPAHPTYPRNNSPQNGVTRSRQDSRGLHAPPWVFPSRLTPHSPPRNEAVVGNHLQRGRWTPNYSELVPSFPLEYMGHLPEYRSDLIRAL